MSDARVVIVGAGHAGGTAAALLRQYGHEGPITLIGEGADPALPAPAAQQGLAEGRRPTRTRWP
jgi:3-phenylpropionate/trans-cinnamate dioxygenase ferredoxin reductase subunit